MAGLLAYAAISLLLASCNSARRVPKGHYLLTRNIFRYRSGPANKKLTSVIQSSEQNLVAEITIPPEIAPDQVLAYVKQKPNTRFLLGLLPPLHLMIYNIFDSTKTAQKKAARNKRIDLKYEKINKKRIAEGKLPISAAVIKAKKAKTTFREKVMNSGEHPVILDSNLLNSSRRQIALFLAAKGYYNCKVRDSVVAKDRRAKVFYIIIPGKPYKISAVHYSFEDTGIAPAVFADTADCLIRPGQNFDYDLFQQERDRITRNLNDKGYFAFGKEYIFFRIDSSEGNRRMNVTIDIRKFDMPVINKVKADSTLPRSHAIFRLRYVIIQMDFNPQKAYKPTDTLRLDKCLLVFPGKKPSIKPKYVLRKLFLHSGDLYRISDIENTYAGMGELRAFRYVNVKIAPVQGDSNLLDCFVQLMPAVRHSIAVEGEGDNTGGDLGVQGDLLYENKNCLRGSEDLQFKLRGGIEAQTIGSNLGQGTINNIIPLNTIDLGGEMDLKVPRSLVFPELFKNSPKDNPQTAIKVLYDYQNRPTFYNRQLFGVSADLNFFLTKLHNVSVSFSPIEWNYDKAILYSNFENYLVSTNDFFLENSFSNHLITDMHGSLTLNNQVVKKDKSFGFLQITVEESGLLPIITDQEANLLLSHKTNEAYSIAGVPYSYFFKSDIEGRYYFVKSKDEKLVLRGLIGWGLPLGNTYELPFDASYWAGGSNDIRGFIARGLGPGANSNSIYLDEIGDIKAEANAEYRFNLIKFINLAIFCDAGNVWLHNVNPAIPNASFPTNFHDFFNEIALSPGVGFRFDFNYFVVRVDFGFPWHDPGLTDMQFFNVKPLFNFSRVAINFGIGYPF